MQGTTQAIPASDMGVSSTRAPESTLFHIIHLPTIATSSHLW